MTKSVAGVRVAEWLAQHRLGYVLSNHSDVTRPQACYPYSTLARGKVEAKGTYWLKAHPHDYLQ